MTNWSKQISEENKKKRNPINKMNTIINISWFLLAVVMLGCGIITKSFVLIFCSGLYFGFAIGLIHNQFILKSEQELTMLWRNGYIRLLDIINKDTKRKKKK